MASDLERLAQAVRQLGDASGPVRGQIARASLSATRASSGVPQGVPSARQAAVALQAAGKALAEASHLLDEFSKEADAFAARLVGGSPQTGARPSPAHVSLDRYHPNGFPDDIDMVPLAGIAPDEQLDWVKGYSPEDLEWAWQAFRSVIQPGLAKGMTQDDFRDMDARLGLMGTRSYADTYSGFFGDSRIILNRKPGMDALDPGNGRHRIAIARRLGLTHVPAKVV
ncbi:hypothetical protein [Raineyella fluvialis]|uniref:Uncharacterized protein n=1 Tax=Raineyella fluvialis TaxID=2662261 RepID=A0A5Q2FE73_9ACTN|nr:hypothetical protein [Raineyella fluvialis]QGF23383.1 hypothetical protein Rai3103_06580 [Raineyella fluvialis]